MYKKIIISTVVFFLMGFMFMAFYSFENHEPQDIKKELDFDAFEPIVVLELFTSQGCSSCPPADVLLQKVKNQYPDKVFALSYHVDYWNYIGWKDPFSDSRYTQKQSFYNRKLGYRGNYTPEIIVNGQEHFVGSSASKMASKISHYGDIKSKNKVELSNVTNEGSAITFDFNVHGDLENKLLRAVLVLDERTTSVKRGENRNRTLTNSNIVVAEHYVDLKNAGSGKVAIPPLVGKSEEITLMLIAETDDMDITGAAKLKV